MVERIVDEVGPGVPPRIASVLRRAVPGVERLRPARAAARRTRRGPAHATAAHGEVAETPNRPRVVAMRGRSS